MTKTKREFVEIEILQNGKSLAKENLRIQKVHGRCCAKFSAMAGMGLPKDLEIWFREVKGEDLTQTTMKDVSEGREVKRKRLSSYRVPP